MCIHNISHSMNGSSLSACISVRLAVRCFYANHAQGLSLYVRFMLRFWIALLVQNFVVF